MSRDPLPLEQLRFANPREAQASRFLEENLVRLTVTDVNQGQQLTLAGTVEDRQKQFTPNLTLDQDQRMIQANCTCNWHQQNKLYQGPCEHILALRMAHSRQG